ncbi:unnamed protein product [Hymenolepis diminuta]|uniref:Reverse transcriptase RNase H-like domain-containing protein n=1 Tax=Hymenolepis diminuta TaxID=6216 RepID=A0A564YCI0_HYMDI|nr:unnamed protein product [Hymenolepis diminuta]
MIYDVGVGKDTWVRHRNQLRRRLVEPISDERYLSLYSLLGTSNLTHVLPPRPQVMDQQNYLHRSKGTSLSELSSTRPADHYSSRGLALAPLQIGDPDKEYNHSERQQTNWGPPCQSQALSGNEPAQHTSGRELLAIYKAVKHFRYLLEGRQFTISTDHKPLTYASRASSDHYSPREIRHLDYILQFTNDIRHVKGSDNIVADCLSRTDVAAVTKAVDFHALSQAQKTDTELQEFRNRPTSIQLKDTPLHTTPGLITCDVLTGLPRPFVPKAFRRQQNYLHRSKGTSLSELSSTRPADYYSSCG